MTLPDYLRDRLKEDEAVVRAATAPGEMHPYGDTDLPEVSIDAFPDEVRGYMGGTWGEHCARWSFARVLAECEAKRRVLDLWDLANREASMGAEWPVKQFFDGRLSIIEAALRALALPYADRDDYDEEWRP